VRWGLEEAGGETHDRKNMKRIGGAVVWVSWHITAKPWLPRGEGVDATGAGG
jgi:hypothetical protein